MLLGVAVTSADGDREVIVLDVHCDDLHALHERVTDVPSSLEGNTPDALGEADFRRMTDDLLDVDVEGLHDPVVVDLIGETRHDGDRELVALDLHLLDQPMLAQPNEEIVTRLFRNVPETLRDGALSYCKVLHSYPH